LSPHLLRIIGVVTVVVMVSAIASAQRFGGSGQSSQRAAQQTTPQTTPPAGQGASQPGGRGGSQNRSNPNQIVSWEWWKDESARKELELTDTQVRKISGLYESRVRQLKPVYEELERQRDLLNKMSQERTVEVPVYAIQVNRVDALRSDLNKTRVIMLYEIHRVLTAKQMLKLGEILDRRAKARGAGGQR
jgi:Spy/CpxP family protein refolding chaperone